MVNVRGCEKAEPKIFFLRLKHFAFLINPLTLKPAITGRDEPGPFFHFRCHHCWPKLASSMVNFCRRKRSFQWCPGQIDRPYGPVICTKMFKKLSEKVRAKFPATTHGCSMVKLLISMTLSSKFFLTASKPSRGPITAAKRKEKEKEEQWKKNQKSKNLKTSKNIWFLGMPKPKCCKIRC